MRFLHSSAFCLQWLFLLPVISSQIPSFPVPPLQVDSLNEDVNKINDDLKCKSVTPAPSMASSKMTDVSDSVLDNVIIFQSYPLTKLLYNMQEG
jgi:hypothetical protein